MNSRVASQLIVDVTVFIIPFINLYPRINTELPGIEDQFEFLIMDKEDNHRKQHRIVPTSF